MPTAVLFDLGARLGVENRSLADFVHGVRPAPVIAVSSSVEPATMVRAIEFGAVGYLASGAEDVELDRSLEAYLARFVPSIPRERCSSCALISCCHVATGRHAELLGAADWEGKSGPARFIAASPVMHELEQTAGKMAASDATILITGESGVGKEVMARFVHRNSVRSQAPFVKVNCAALPSSLLESELFGHVKGAFTDATASRSGKFSAAAGGTILLDEISEMSLELQAKLLHVLQDGRFTPLGSDRELEVSAQIMATSNRDLAGEIAAGRFRLDLYYRLCALDLHVPSLRERPEDIPILIDHFLCSFAVQYSRPMPEPSPRLLSLLMGHRWAGNIRELENMIKRLVILGDELPLLRLLLDDSLAYPPRPADSERPSAPVELPDSVQRGQAAWSESEPRSLKEIGLQAAAVAEREHIAGTLVKTHWNRRKAARILSVSYKTLLNKIKKFGLAE